MQESPPETGINGASAALATFLRQHPNVLALTGAGCSTGSGIPDYRDVDGSWKHARPVLYPDFISRLEVRRRYWARSALGWPRFATARPNPAHQALAELERQGLMAGIITQNVDRLHQLAGSQAVIDLHGRLDVVRCLGCNARLPRTGWQAELDRENPGWSATLAEPAPDGDAVPAVGDYASFRVPDCRLCGGILKPDVVFYGEAVPADVTGSAESKLAAADALLVVGSSLMVYSGFRLVRAAVAAGKPVVAVNLGRTRADDLLAFHWRTDCGRTLRAVLDILAP